MNSNQIGRNTKLKTIFQTSTPPKHQTQKSNPYFRPPNTKSKPRFSAPKHKTQNPFSYFQRNQTETSNPNLRAKTKPLATSDLKLSNPNRINLKPAKTEFTAFFFLMFAWGVDLRGQGREEKRDREDGIVWVLMKRRG